MPEKVIAGIMRKTCKQRICRSVRLKNKRGFPLTIAGSAVITCLELVSRGVDKEVSELPAERAEATHLPVHPVKALLTLRGVCGNELAMLLRKVLNNGR